MACNKNVASDCYNLGYMYEIGDGINQDNIEALSYYNKACSLGHENSCKYYAGLKKLTGGKNADNYYIQTITKATGLKNKKEVWEYIKNLSSNGNMVANNYILGTLIRTAPQDYKEIVKESEKICAGGYAYGCNLIGFLYSDGKKVEKDIRLSKEYFNKSCKLGNNIGCQNYKAITK